MGIWRQCIRPFHTKRFLKDECSAGCVFCWMSVYSISCTMYTEPFCQVFQSFWNSCGFLQGKHLFPKGISWTAIKSPFAEIKLWSQTVDNRYWMKSLHYFGFAVMSLDELHLWSEKSVKKFCCNVNLILSIML